MESSRERSLTPKISWSTSSRARRVLHTPVSLCCSRSGNCRLSIGWDQSNLEEGSRDPTGTIYRWSHQNGSGARFPARTHHPRLQRSPRSRLLEATRNAKTRSLITFAPSEPVPVQMGLIDTRIGAYTSRTFAQRIHNLRIVVSVIGRADTFVHALRGGIKQMLQQSPNHGC